MKSVKSILALFTLLVFLFPQVEKEVHNFHHQFHIRCTEHDFVHFHKAEHHCYLCDFTSPVSPKPVLYKFVFTSLPVHSSQFFYTASPYLLHPKDFHSLRGPPFVA